MTTQILSGLKAGDGAAPVTESPTLDGGLVRKLAEVMSAVGRVPKRGRNTFHGYDYATEADIVELVRQEMARRHVMLIPSVVKHERIETGKATKTGGFYCLTILTMCFTFYDGESGQSIASEWMGAGWDAEDKGLFKAMTGAEKYFLMKTFLLPTGDDPERDKRKPEATPKVQAASAPQIIGASAVQRPVGPNGGDSGTPRSPREFDVDGKPKWMGRDGDGRLLNELPRPPHVNPYTGEEYPPLPPGSYYVWKYEHDDHGWHHGWISTTGDTGLSALEVKTKRDIGEMLQAAAESKKPVALRYNDRNWVTTIDWYVPTIHGKSEPIEPALIADDIPF